MTVTENHQLTQLTAPILSIEAANGVRYAYRRFGHAAIDRPPLVFLQHFRGTLDNWDPVLVDQLAEHREVILPDARLRIFPDAAHGFLFQYPPQFAGLVDEFLAG
ncbi:hypothetical protein [Nocardia sp. NPDC005825]|uniref:alpha/beta fold hydrolase n=1 Tax=unclassified Nocardia TaxID=2637762 RepID=UPI0033E6ADFB